ncbi:TetR/AcrR family transcriptional regulator [Brevibacillus centrosporus]|uniref:Transcriptional regulator, TetR family n=1 Tax=Brevibacillus centrosporus TaxID=54910 RepID=A0A1I3RAA5_9BACL|nr:TetR/AcrR family transcriptional regulator [Brevibacillus centrosporus]SFJ42116.1 transcriptional regulator, TetR family [Brevibacillus centrosporus]
MSRSRSLSEKQINRMFKYFVEATIKIIEEEGIQNVTARKVGDVAGFNGSALYRYFDELSHLVFFGCIKFIQAYFLDVQDYISKGNNSVEKYLLSWECFCEHSFKQPDIYHAFYVADLGKDPHEMLKKYFSHYQTDLIGIPEDILPSLLDPSLTNRSKAILQKAVDEGLLKSDFVEEINEINVLIWKGMLTTFINNRSIYTEEEAVERAMHHIRMTTLTFGGK